MIPISQAIVSWFRLLTAKEGMSLNAFNNAIEEFGKPEIRYYRKKIYDLFPDYTIQDFSHDDWKNKILDKPIDTCINIKNARAI